MVWAKDFFDAVVGDLFLAADALGLDTEQDFYAVACTLGDLGGGDAAVEPEGDCGMADVVVGTVLELDSVGNLGVWSAVSTSLRQSCGDVWPVRLLRSARCRSVPAWGLRSRS
jgi:hypothetical protein